MRFLIVPWISGLLALAAPQLALAQSESAIAEARTRFDLGVQHFERGDFALAAVEFQRVYALMDGHPNRSYVLYNIARTHEELGRTRAALEVFERYLAESGPDAPNRAEAERHARELRTRLELEAGDRGDASAVGGGVSPIGIIVTSVGGAALVAGIITGVLALDADAAVEAECDYSERCYPEARARAAEAQTLANATDALLFGGAAVAVAGVILMMALPGSDSSAATVSAGCSASGCGAVVRGRF